MRRDYRYLPVAALNNKAQFQPGAIEQALTEKNAISLFLPP
jgi:hypothetical protein